jgi:hypothetical protein
MSDEKIPSPYRKLLSRMMDTFAEHQWDSLLRSYYLAMRPERKARLAAVIELSVELVKIRAVSINSTAFHEQIIEAIIEGNWKDAAQVNGWLGDREAGDPNAEMYLKLWENFRAITLSACAAAERRAANPGSETALD